MAYPKRIDPQFTFEDIERNFHMASLAYAIASLYYSNPSDIAFNEKYGISPKASLLSNRNKFAKLHAEGMYYNNFAIPPNQEHTETATYWRDRAFDLKQLKTYDCLPVAIKMNVDGVWTYSIPEIGQIHKRYSLFAIKGNTGHNKAQPSGIPTISGVALFPKADAKSKDVYLSFRGTQGGIGWHSAVLHSSPDWITNTNNTLTATKISAVFPGKMHSGFFNAFNSYINQIVSLLERYEEELGIDEFNKITIYVSGHSLGAAMATITAYYLQKFYNFTVKLFAFASPRIGDTVFTKAVERELANNIFSIYLKDDPVVRSPEKFTHHYQMAPAAVDLLQIDPSYARFFPRASILHRVGVDERQHYLESLRYFIYQHFARTASYKPLIQKYVSGLAPVAHALSVIKTEQGNIFGTSIPRAYQLLITGETFVHGPLPTPAYWDFKNAYNQACGTRLTPSPSFSSGSSSSYASSPGSSRSPSPNPTQSVFAPIEVAE